MNARDHAREVVAQAIAERAYAAENFPYDKDDWTAWLPEADAAIDAVLGLLPEDRVSELWRGDPKHDGYNARIDGYNAALAEVRERLGAS